MMFGLFIATLSVAACTTTADGRRPFCSSDLDVIKFKDSSFEMAGDVVSENEESVVLVPENGGRVELRRELLDTIEYDVRPPTRMTTDEMVEGFTHCVSRLIGGQVVFHIAKVSSAAVYLNLGEDGGAHPGIELSVFREGEELFDPESGASLGKDKEFIGVIQVISTDKAFSKAVPIDTPVEKIKEGDIGIYLRESPVLAVAGITTTDGEESEYGAMLSEKLLAKFKENPNLRVVERRSIGKVLRELALQNALLKPLNPDAVSSGFKKLQTALGPQDLKADESEPDMSPSLADKMKMIKGADALILGTVSDIGGSASVNLRVVDTSTAAILYSTHKIIGKPEKSVGPKTEETAAPEETEQDADVSAQPARAGVKSSEPDMLDRILRAIYSR